MRLPSPATAAAAETQLAGTPANIAIAGPDNGRYVVPGILNFNSANNSQIMQNFKAGTARPLERA